MHLAALLVLRYPPSSVKFLYIAIDAQDAPPSSRTPYIPFKTLQYARTPTNPLWLSYDLVDTISGPAFVVYSQIMREDTCYTADNVKRNKCTFTLVPTKFLLRDRWGEAALLKDYEEYGFKKSVYDKASEKLKAEVVKDLLFSKEDAAFEEEDGEEGDEGEEVELDEN